MKEPEFSVPVRSRTTIGPGAPRVDLRIQCPVQNTDVALAECGVCERSLGVRSGSRASELFVLCRAKRREEPSEADRWGPEGRRVLSIATQAELTQISEIMTTHVVCVSPGLRVSLLHELLEHRGIAGVPVVDDAGHPVGVVSKADLLRKCDGPPADGGSATATATVRDIMTPLVFCLPANESVAKAAALMTFEGVHRLPILGPLGEVIGILSPLDVLRWMARQSGFIVGTRA
jgi:CBS domain-containing protein